jgi:ABC-type nitrate/sulfonate/bicarbonate transport system substrate-binding protein
LAPGIPGGRFEAWLVEADPRHERRLYALLEVRPVYVRGGPIVMAALLSGEADYAVMAGITAVNSINRGADVIIVGGHTAHLDQALIAAKGISTVNDLKGKVVGVTGSGGVTEFAIVEALARKGLVRDRDYKVMFTNNSPMRVSALQNGIIQAAPFSATERGLLEAKGFPTLFEIGKAIPELPFVVIVTPNLKAKSQPSEAMAFLRAMRNSISFIQNETRKVILFLGKKDPGANPAMLEKSLNYVIDSFSVTISKRNIEALMRAASLKLDGNMDRFFREDFVSQLGSDRHKSQCLAGSSSALIDFSCVSALEKERSRRWVILSSV